jgi:large subunit ribosomal protein L21
MYAIIRAGGKQAKVSEGDVVDVDRVKTDGDVTFVPLLIVQKDGTVISDRDKLANATVTAEVLGESSGPKVDIFKYKAKTGYRRRAGHRQKYTQLQIKKIDVPGAKKPAAKKPAAKKPAAKKPAAKSATAKKPAAKSTTAEKPAAKPTTAKKTAAKSTTNPAKKKTTSSSTAKSTTAEKPAAKKKPPDAEKGA